MNRVSSLLLATLLGACAGNSDVVSGALGGMALACGALTCGGCCDQQGACQKGTANDVCGGGGRACTSCQAKVCEPDWLGNGGSCVPCSSTNCTGCCDQAGDCRPGTEDTACGFSTCQVCSGGQTCQYQSCF